VDGGLAMARKWAVHGLISCAVIAAVFLFSPRSFAGDTDTARNYLSTIVSCLSTILALCISITLVAIQLTASRYTHRVLDLFVKLPFNVSLMLFYFVTIIQSLFLLSRITEPIRETLPPYLQPQMNADMLLVVLCFAILIGYMYAVMNLLKPERIVAEIEREFCGNIRRDRARDALQNIEQICDIAKRAASEMDSTTGMIAVTTLFSMAKQTRAARASVVRQFVEIGAIAAKEREGGMLGGVLASLRRTGHASIAESDMDEARAAVTALLRLTRTGLLGQQLLPFVQDVVAALFGLARRGAQCDVSFALDAFAAIAEIGREAVLCEPDGGDYVARSVLSEPFGRLLQALPMADSRSRLALICEYARLLKVVLARCDPATMEAVIVWVAHELAQGAHRRSWTCATPDAAVVAVLLVALCEHVGARAVVRSLLAAVRHGGGRWRAGEIVPESLLAVPEARDALFRLFDFCDPKAALLRADQVLAGSTRPRSGVDAT